MERSIGLTSQFVVAMLLVAMFGAASVASGDTRADSRNNAHPNHSGSRVTPTSTAKALPESTALMQHDEVLPTQNRTQAMALEAENGKLPQVQEDELKRTGLVKNSN